MMFRNPHRREPEKSDTRILLDAISEARGDEPVVIMPEFEAEFPISLEPGGDFVDNILCFYCRGMVERGQICRNCGFKPKEN
jgi:hypothetical protein